jgi:transcriptional regulator with XRE-family HTH domain
MGDLLQEVRAVRRLPPPAMARAIRLAAGVTQARLARELGVDRTTVLRWELGKRRPSRRVARAYAELLANLQAEMGTAVG